MFFYHENGDPIMPEEWTFVITQLYRKKVGLEAEAMELNGIKAVSTHLCYLNNGRSGVASIISFVL